MYRHSFNSRAVSEVLGTIIILGMTVIMMGMLASQGGVMINSLEEQSNEIQLENEFTHLAGKQATVGYSEGARGEFTSTSIQNELQVYNFTVTVNKIKDDGSRTQIFKEEITGFKYKQDDSMYYIASGGVFRYNTETKYTEVVTKPSFDFSDSTVTFPLISVSTVDSSYRAGEKIIMNHNSIDTGGSNYVASNSVEINISGESSQSWGKAIKKQSGTEVTYNNSTNTTTATFGIERIVVGGVNESITSTGSVTVTGGGTVNGNVSGDDISGDNNINGSTTETTNDYPTLDSYITAVVSDASTNATEVTISEGDTITNGYYYVDGDVLLTDKTTTFDAKDGNITVVVDGDMSFTNDANVKIINTTDEKTVEFIVDGTTYEVKDGSPSITVENNTKGHHVVYGNSDLEITISQSAVWEGVIYAPQSSSTSGSPTRGGGANCKTQDVSVCIGGNANVTGSIIAGDMKVGQSSTLTYDDNLTTFELDKKPVKNTERVEITFLHLTTFEINSSKEYN